MTAPLSELIQQALVAAKNFHQTEPCAANLDLFTRMETAVALLEEAANKRSRLVALSDESIDFISELLESRREEEKNFHQLLFGDQNADDRAISQQRIDKLAGLIEACAEPQPASPRP